MKILHISVSDKIGGAAIAASRLNTAMIMAGWNSKLLVLYKRSIDDDVVSVTKYKTKVLYYGIRAMNYLINKYVLKPVYIYSSALWGIRVCHRKELQEADVIYVHWINNDFLSVKELKRILCTNKKVIFFMHDMWTITGGCHYSFDCDKYKTKCRNCPHLGGHIIDMALYVFKKKYKFLTPYQNLFFVTPSTWLGDCVKQSALFGNKKIKVIPNIIDTHIFKSIDQEVARSLFGLPVEKKLILFGADAGTSNPYKGWSYLKEALIEVQIPDVEIVVFGNKLPKEEEKEIPYKVHSVGRLNDEYSLSLLYNAVDIFITPSLADNFPNTILEALACVTPVVAFNTGGIPDLVKHKLTGYLAEYKSSKSLAQGIEWILDHLTDDTFIDSMKEYTRIYLSEKNILGKHKVFIEEILSSNE